MEGKKAMSSLSLSILLLFSALPAAEGFASTRSPRVSCTRRTSTRPLSELAESSARGGNEVQPRGDCQPHSISTLNRRDAIGHAYRAAAIVAASAAVVNPTVSNADIEGVATISKSTAPPESKDTNGVTVFKTTSGLQYIEIAEGTGPSPKYGNFVTIAYKAYIKLPDAQGKTFELDEFDSDRAYLVKHGNGRTVPGLDEGLHTMKVGGKRRIIVPPKLGYITSGLGPIPVGPYGRWKLNRLIDRMVEFRGGNVIFDVEMKSMLEDEADQGYYEDDSLTPDDFNTLRKNIESQQQAARAEKGLS